MTADESKEDYPRPDQLMPHGSAFVLLDQVLSCDGQSAVCRLKVDVQKSLGVRQDSVTALVALEYIAQTAAVLGALQSSSRGTTPEPGFLLAVKKMQMFRRNFLAGETLLITVKLDCHQESLRVFIAELRSARDGQLLVSGEISIYVSADLNQIG